MNDYLGPRPLCGSEETALGNSKLSDLLVLITPLHTAEALQTATNGDKASVFYMKDYDRYTYYLRNSSISPFPQWGPGKSPVCSSHFHSTWALLEIPSSLLRCLPFIKDIFCTF